MVPTSGRPPYGGAGEGGAGPEQLPAGPESLSSGTSSPGPRPGQIENCDLTSLFNAGTK